MKYVNTYIYTVNSNVNKKEKKYWITDYLIQFNFRVVLIFAQGCAKISTSEKVVILGCAKISTSEIFDFSKIPISTICGYFLGFFR